MKKGFTLIELLVVIAILSLLISIVLVSLNGSREKANFAVKLQFEAQVDHLLKAEQAAEYDFENTTNNWSDASGNGLNIDQNKASGCGIIAGSIDSQMGKFALRCTGSGSVTIDPADYLKFPLDFVDKFTISAWIYPTFVDSGSIARKENQYELSMNNGKLVFNIYDSAGQPIIYTTPDVAVKVNEWQQVVATYNKDKMKVFVNGKEMGPGQATTTSLNENHAGKVYIGQNYGGNMDRIRFYGDGF